MSNVFSGGMSPNTEHQLWSHWTFSITGGRGIPIETVRTNAKVWLAAKFGKDVGQARVQRCLIGDGVHAHTSIVIECQISHPNANDPEFVAHIRSRFESEFVSVGFGELARGHVDIKILAGNPSDGKPPAQLIAVDMKLPINGSG